MRRSIICVDAGPVIQLVAFPDNTLIQDVWDAWDREQQKVVAPTLLYYEVTNVLYRYQSQGLLRQETISTALLAALSLPIELVGDADLHLQAKELAAKYHLPSAYDAHYLALTERLGGELWTTDKRLVNILRPMGIEWLKCLGVD